MPTTRASASNDPVQTLPPLVHLPKKRQRIQRQPLEVIVVSDDDEETKPIKRSSKQRGKAKAAKAAGDFFEISEEEDNAKSTFKSETSSLQAELKKLAKVCLLFMSAERADLSPPTVYRTMHSSKETRKFFRTSS